MCDAVEFQADMVPVEDVVGVVLGRFLNLRKGDRGEVCHGECVCVFVCRAWWGCSIDDVSKSPDTLYLSIPDSVNTLAICPYCNISFFPQNNPAYHQVSRPYDMKFAISRQTGRQSPSHIYFEAVWRTIIV
jgi:hypothetical protein